MGRFNEAAAPQMALAVRAERPRVLAGLHDSTKWPGIPHLLGAARPRRRGDRMSARQASWCDPAGGRPVRVRVSARLVANVAWAPGDSGREAYRAIAHGSRVSRRTNVVKRDFDLIVYGATGYTGRLIAEYLATSYRGDDAPSWAIAGRSTDKLQKVRADIGAPDDLPLVKADAAEPASLRSMCERAAVIIAAVGPYQLHGPELVAACAATGTAYVDLCGEPAWMRRMIDAHHEEAKRTGARIVFSCGFDSIPFDLGVLTLQEKAREKFGRPARRVKARLRKVKGGMSGGTAASARATTETFATMVSLFRTGGLKPGAGPTREEREKGFYDILFLGELPDGGRVEAVVTGDRDPGYGSTSKMIAESALCLVRDVQGEGGTWTPGALMGPALRKRLKERAGLTFSAR